jgi:hypothetical protein
MRRVGQGPRFIGPGAAGPAAMFVIYMTIAAIVVAGAALAALAAYHFATPRGPSSGAGAPLPRGGFTASPPLQPSGASAHG